MPDSNEGVAYYCGQALAVIILVCAMVIAIAGTIVFVEWVLS